MSDQNDFNIEDELLGAIDELLEQVEEQKRTREPDHHNALLDGPLDDQGQVVDVSTPNPTPENDALNEDAPDNEELMQTPDEESAIDAPEPEAEPDTDPAQDALFAIDQVESSAETLLEESLDALLDDVETTNPDAPSESTTPEPADTAEPEPVDTDDALDEDEPEDEPASTPNASDQDVSLDDAIDEMLAAAPEPAKAPAPDNAQDTEPDPEPEDTDDDEPEAKTPDDEDDLAGSIDASMDQLDEALAGAAEEIINGAARPSDSELVEEDPDNPAESAVVEAIIHEEDEESLIEDAASSVDDDLNLDDALDQALESPSDPAPKPEAKPESKPAPIPETEPDPAANPKATTPQDDSPADEPTEESAEITVPAWFVRFVEIVRPKLDTIDPRKGKTVDLLAQGLGRTLGALRFYTPKYAFKVSSILSKPIDKQPPQIRAAIGYLGLWTLMLALVVWFYAMFVRTPSIPEPSEAPTRVLESSPDTAHAAQNDL